MTHVDADGFAVYDRGEPRRRRTERPAPRPLDALDSQVSTIDALSGTHGEAMLNAMTGDGDRLVKPRAAMRGARELAGALNTATTVVVTDRMLDFVLDRMGSIPFGDPLKPDDLLFESGYFVFSRPITVGELVDDDWNNIPPRKVAQFDAGFYVPGRVALVDQLRNDELMTDGIMYAQSASMTLMDNYLAALRYEALAKGASRADVDSLVADVEEGIRRMRSVDLKHVPVYASGMGFGISWDPEVREEDFVLTPAGDFERRFWLSLFRTVVEEVFAPVRFKRADYRRATRRGLIPDVVVADLRRVKHTAKEERLVTGETIMWSHRWRRRGHTRTLNRGTEKEKTVWVREHICGPDSMPLIEKDRVHRLSR